MNRFNQLGNNFLCLKSASKKSVNFQIKFFLKISFLLSSYPSLFYSSNKMCYLGSCPLGKCEFQEISCGELSVMKIDYSGNCPSGNCPSWKYLREPVCHGNVRRGILHKNLSPFNHFSLPLLPPL